MIAKAFKPDFLFHSKIWSFNLPAYGKHINYLKKNKSQLSVICGKSSMHYKIHNNYLFTLFLTKFWDL